jgi:hypothetical protein
MTRVGECHLLGKKFGHYTNILLSIVIYQYKLQEVLDFLSGCLLGNPLGYSDYLGYSTQRQAIG